MKCFAAAAEKIRMRRASFALYAEISVYESPEKDLYFTHLDKSAGT